MNTLPLPGCGPVPLVNYLKALGVLRVLVLRPDSEGDERGAWQNEQFVLSGAASREELVNFFLNTYRPSAIVAPWNGGSGFHPKDNKAAITAISKGKADRLSLFREVIESAEAALNQLGLEEKPGPEQKGDLLQLCRNTFPDDALGWLDAAFVLTEDSVRYPPLLGTGGNDGRLDFTNNYMQRITEVMDPDSGAPLPGSEALLANALFGETVNGLADNAIGQFGPAAAGGANASSGFSAKALVNPWDFILMLEGAIAFAAASVKRLGSTSGGQLAYPFSVRTTGAGYGSAAAADESDSRCEMWMPLWSNFASYREIQGLLSEGRVQIGMKPARDGLDFYRAITALGVDRGIDAFQRYGFLVRNGLAYFATPMDRVQVRRNTRADLLADLDRNDWLDRFRRAAQSPNAPGSVARACRELERAIIALCSAGQSGDAAAFEVRQVIIALGRCEQAMAKSMQWTKDNYQRPVPLLSPGWLVAGAMVDDSTMVEYRLAAALASLTLTGNFGENSHPLRAHLEGVELGGPATNRWVNFSKHESRDIVGLNGHLIDRMNAIVHRRLMLCHKIGKRNWQEYAPVTAHLPDIAAFVEGTTDDDLLKNLLAGLSLINWADKKISEPEVRKALRAPTYETTPDTFYALLKLCHPAQKDNRDDSLPLNPAIHRMAAAGKAAEAARFAIQRLTASGLLPAFRELTGFAGDSRRAAAAILFPLWRDQLESLLKQLGIREAAKDSTGEPVEVAEAFPAE
jgi:CRISPR-associated protein Csx17